MCTAFCQNYLKSSHLAYCSISCFRERNDILTMLSTQKIIDQSPSFGLISGCLSIALPYNQSPLHHYTQHTHGIPYVPLPWI